MSKNIWVISDTHFNHENIIKYCNRPFSNAKEMDEAIVDNWNSVVKQGDKVYHLGDVFFGDKDYFQRLWARLNGSKRLIVGNHDDIKYLSSGAFLKKVYMWRMFPEFGLLLTHVPVHENSLFRGSTGNEENPDQLTNIHGHIHENESPKGPYKCVCVEQINYTPINIEELRIK